MRTKIFFTMPEKNIPVNNQKQLNSYIHRVLGHDNSYHDTFSNYAISSLQGGKLMPDGNLKFESNPYIVVSSEDPTFIGLFLEGVQNMDEKFFDMSYLRIELGDYAVHEYFDKVNTISPILIKKDGKKLTIKDDGWLEAITENCIKKLEYKGVSTKGFNIEIRNPERAKKKIIYVGDVFNPCSMVSLKITGTKKARKTLYNLGIGNSTGSGFGTIEIYP